MNDKNQQKNIGKECAYIAVFVALTIAAQLCLSVVPGVEIVTVLFVAFSFAFGVRRGMIAGTAFSLLRQLVFGFLPVVLILYLLYFNALTALFGFLGKKWQTVRKRLLWIVLIACVCTVCFTLLDNLLTVLWYAYAPRAAKIYFYASLSVMLPQVVCTAVTVTVLFTPLCKIFQRLEKNRCL